MNKNLLKVSAFGVFFIFSFLISYWGGLFSSFANSVQFWIDQKDGKIIVNWGEGEAPGDVEITAYNYTTKKDELLGKVSGKDLKFEIPLTCDYIEKYTFDSYSKLNFSGFKAFDLGFSYELEVRTAEYDHQCNVPMDDKAYDDILYSISHHIEDDKLTLSWDKMAGDKKFIISAYDYEDKRYLTIGTPKVSDGSFTQVLDCDFYAIYWNNPTISLLFVVPSGKSFKYEISLRAPTLASCNSGALVSPGNDNTTRFIKEIDAEVTSEKVTSDNLSGSTSKKPSLKGEWYLEGDQKEILANGYTREMNNAYLFASHYGLTSAPDIYSANLDGEITRAAMAKIMSNFVINVMDEIPVTPYSCHFDDVDDAMNKKYDNGITLSCSFGIMGVGIKNFRPYDKVYRSEFGTVLSRLMLGIKDGSPYYEPHLKALNGIGVISNMDPEKVEKRGNVLLMLMRSALTLL